LHDDRRIRICTSDQFTDPEYWLKVSLYLFKADREELELGLVLKECLESTGKAHSFLLHFSRALSHITQFFCYQKGPGRSSYKMFNGTGIRESPFRGMHDILYLFS
jgi:hypothetical protein